jgi:hypothetical protein
MAKGSEHLTWGQLKGYDRACWSCGREIKVLADVGDHRAVYPGPRKQIRCSDCIRGK